MSRDSLGLWCIPKCSRRRVMGFKDRCRRYQEARAWHFIHANNLGPTLQRSQVVKLARVYERVTSPHKVEILIPIN